MTSAAPTPRSGQIAPNRQADLARRSPSPRGLVPRPAPGPWVLLAQAHLVLKPDFYRCLGIEPRRDRAHTLGAVFLNSFSWGGACPRWRGRAEMWRKPSRA